MIIKILSIFIFAWSGLIISLIILSIIGFFIVAPNFVEGWIKVTDTFSPFNIANTIVMILLALPVIGAIKLKEYLEKKIKNS